MSRRIHRLGLLLAFLFASEVWALGLGDIRLDSALNEPLKAQIELLSATQEELDNLRISLASNETFDRYGIDRPQFLQGLEFRVTGSGANSVVNVTSRQPITEPFVTFLIEAVWTRGRLLREYTVLLDPPTFAPPPPAPTAEAVTAPQQTRPADRGQIDRQPAPPRRQPAARQPAPAPVAPAAPEPEQRRPAPAEPAAPARGFDTGAGSDYEVRRGDTLWRIAERVRPDDRLSMNQTMLAIYEANPRAFAGNINVLRANTRLRVPSADEIYQISRGSANAEIRRQNQVWRGETPSAPQPTLTLVPPDEDEVPDAQSPRIGTDTDRRTPAAADAGQERRINDLEARVAEQESLLEIRDSELARLREELRRLREERAAAEAAAAAAPGVALDETPATDEPPAPSTTDEPVAEQPVEPPPVRPAEPAPQVVTTPRRDEPGIVGSILGFLTSIWGLLGLALLAVVGVLLWFARRASGTSGEAEDTGSWEALGPDKDADAESIASTERLRALARDDETSIMVVEQAGGDTVASEDLSLPDVDIPAADIGEAAAPVSIEDTFSSETAVNLDKSDPLAEADFHMAYGLYDQAADLINGAVEVEPERIDLKAKLCEIYFVWGNRDRFVEAAESLQNALGHDRSAEWDNVLIMGQQIAPEEPLFADSSPSRVVQSVDVDLESGDGGGVDIDLEAPDGLDEIDSDSSAIIDLGGEDFEQAGSTRGGMLDFDSYDEKDTAASATREMPKDFGDDIDATAESPTIEQPLGEVDSTSELPLIREDADAGLGKAADATAEIDIADLGLELGSMAGADAGDDLDATSESRVLEDTGTAKLPETDDDLLAATGMTQVLSEDDLRDKAASGQEALSDDDATMMAPGPGADEDSDFEFAKTESLPSDTFEDSDSASDDTAESPMMSTEMDLDLGDLTAALQVSESGDTIEQQRDDKTVEQPVLSGDDNTVERPALSGDDDGIDFGLGSNDVTQEIGPDDVSDELQEARTMTEVGTKLDLARAYIDMGDPGGARNILEEVLEEGDEGQRQQAQQLLDSLPS